MIVCVIFNRCFLVNYALLFLLARVSVSELLACTLNDRSFIAQNSLENSRSENLIVAVTM